MHKLNSKHKKLTIPDYFIVFISGVPGVGKTTISYELLKRFNEFRIVEETDLIREVLRGYNDFLINEFCDNTDTPIAKIEISDHKKLLTLEEAKQQCNLMKSSFEKIVARQQRKSIPTIINGVHIVPEVLSGFALNGNVIFINLFIRDEHTLFMRLLNRDPRSYMLNHTSLIYQTNLDLHSSTSKLSKDNDSAYNNIDVTALSVNETIEEIIECINQRVKGKS